MNGDVIKERYYTPEQYIGTSLFVHLHSHTVFSTLDGVSSPQQYADECKARGYPAMAVTEHGHMASVPDMYFAFSDYGIKYIPGCEIYYNDHEPLRQQLVKRGMSLKAFRESMLVKAPHLTDRISRNRHLTILAKNEVGFRNLIELTTMAYEWGFYYKPRIWFEKLAKYREGLIVLSGCLNGPVAHELRLDSYANNGVLFSKRHIQDPITKKTVLTDHFEPNVVRSSFEHSARDYVKKFHDVFGDDYYIELQMPGLPELFDHETFWNLNNLADEFGIKTVLANDCHYLDRKSWELQKVMMAVAQDKMVDDPELFHVNSDEQYMKTRAELWAMFKNNRYSEHVSDSRFEEMCDNTLLIADKCERIKIDTAPKIPDWKVIDGKNADMELTRIVIDELKRRGLGSNDKKYLIDGNMVTYMQQAKIELERFIDKGFASYFLITRDLLKFGKEQGWPFGPRGSCGGSLVCYLLGITSLNPLPWGLSFDRFLAPSRGGFMLKIVM